MKQITNKPVGALPRPDPLSGLRWMLEPSAPATNSAPADPAATAATARRMLEALRLRDRHLPISLLAEPAWAMLLELYVAEADRREISIGRLCAGVSVPPKTARRWIMSLEEEGCVRRLAGARDGPAVLVALTDAVRQALDRYLADVV